MPYFLGKSEKISLKIRSFLRFSPHKNAYFRPVVKTGEGGDLTVCDIEITGTLLCVCNIKHTAVFHKKTNPLHFSRGVQLFFSFSRKLALKIMTCIQ